MICHYCGEPGIHTACNGDICCDYCWIEGGMKDWTPEQQADLDKISKEINSWLPDRIKEIKVENGLTPDAPGWVCLKCRKIIQFDEEGNAWCECHDERGSSWLEKI